MSTASSVPDHVSAYGETGTRRALLLARTLAVLERSGRPWCVLHGAEGFPDRIGRDVDLLVAPALGATELARRLADEIREVGARVVRCTRTEIVLAGHAPERPPVFLALDLHRTCETAGRVVHPGADALRRRVRSGSFWTLPPELEFKWQAVRSIARGDLPARRTSRLSELFVAAPERCRQELAPVLGPAGTQLICRAAETQDWAAVQADLAGLRAALERAAPGGAAHRVRQAFDRVADLARALWRPPGVSVAFLGPDGAGKSTAAATLEERPMAELFARTIGLGFAPPLHRLAGINHGPSSEPHKLPPRSFLVSAVRALYWWLYYCAIAPYVRLLRARRTAVTFDRHFVDILVDPKRYRYRGPIWPMRLIWALIPRPDLVLLLDAPAATIQARKREVPFAETERQRRAYVDLVRPLRCGRLIDAGKPLASVRAAIFAAILDHLADRTEAQLGIRRPPREARATLATCPAEPRGAE